MITFDYGDQVMFNGNYGLISGSVYKKFPAVLINRQYFNVSIDLLVQIPKAIPSKTRLRRGYLISKKSFEMDETQIFHRCMENPRGLQGINSDTYYFGGYSRKEALEFINWFNENYTFAEISIEHVDSLDITGACARDIYTEPGEDWLKIVYKVKLRYPNKFVAKLLFVFLRTYFLGENYDKLRILEKLKGKTPLEILTMTINNGYGSSHYFYRKIGVKKVLDVLEKYDFTGFNSDIYSQTSIYLDLVRRGEK